MRVFKFTLLWVMIFVLTYLALSLADAVPVEIDILNGKVSSLFGVFNKGEKEQTIFVPEEKFDEKVLLIDSASSTQKEILPTRIIIKRLGVDSPIVNPDSNEVAVLDEALKSGVVRYPGSGGLLDERNMLLFGHSTPLREVKNVAYRAFNRLNEIVLGDSIVIQSKEGEYIYKVFSVRQVGKEEALVEFKKGEKMITISTCDNFGAKSDRIVVEARFVQSFPLSI